MLCFFIMNCWYISFGFLWRCLRGFCVGFGGFSGVVLGLVLFMGGCILFVVAMCFLHLGYHKAEKPLVCNTDFSI